MPKFRFDSVAELIAAGSGAYAYPPNVHDCEETRSYGWICADRRHVSRPSEAVAALREPMFEPGVKRIEALMSGLDVPTPIQVRRVAVRADAGDELDMQRVWSGELETAWRTMRRTSRVGPMRVLIAANACTSASTSASKLAIRGAASIALAQALREAGHTVQISAAIDTYLHDRTRTTYQAEVVVCACGDELDIHKLASLMASGLLLRGIFFNHMYRLATSRAPGLSPGRTTLSDAALDKSGFDYVAVIENDCDSVAGAQAWINSHVAAIDARVRGELEAA